MGIVSISELRVLLLRGRRCLHVVSGFVDVSISELRVLLLREPTVPDQCWQGFDHPISVRSLFIVALTCYLSQVSEPVHCQSLIVTESAKLLSGSWVFASPAPHRFQLRDYISDYYTMYDFLSTSFSTPIRSTPFSQDRHKW